MKALKIKHVARFDRSVYIDYSQPNRYLTRAKPTMLKQVAKLIKNAIKWWTK